MMLLNYFKWNFKSIFKWNLLYDFYKTPFYLAIEKGEIEIIKLFLENAKADLNDPYVLI